MIDRADITGAILCGGRATRMGGVEKPLTLFLGAPMLQHVRERLAPQVSHIIISANREHERYAAMGDPIVADEFPDAGPLGGVRAVLTLVRTPYLCCCPGDAPLLDTRLVARLAAALSQEHVAVAIPDDGVRPQYLFLLMKVDQAVASLDAYLATEQRSVHGWLATIAHTVVPARDIAMSFANINSSQELSALERRVFA